MLNSKFMSLFFALAEKSSDGKLTLDELSECLSEFAPEYFEDVYVEVQAAQEDGVITWGEIMKIASAVIF